MESVESGEASLALEIQGGFDKIEFNEGHFRQENLRKGKELLHGGHLVNVVENRNGGRVLVTGECVPEMSIRKPPYKIQFTVQSESRKVLDARCSCVAGILACCKHAAALFLFVNEERCTGPTDNEQKWQKPAKKSQALYPKGETTENIFCLKKKEKISFKSSPEKKQRLAEELQQFGLEHCSLYKTISAPSAPPPAAEDEESDGKNIKPSIHPGLSFTKNTLDSFFQKDVPLITLAGIESLLRAASVLGPSEQNLPEQHPSCQNEVYKTKIVCSAEKKMDIFRETLGQSTKKKWFEERAVRISSSVAHAIFRARTEETCLRHFMAPVFDNSSVRYGRKMEPVAKKKYQEVTGFKVHDSGLVVRQDKPWLCSSPDGFVEDRSGNIFPLEIKCPATCEGREIRVPYVRESTLQKGTYYTQVQLQMYCCNVQKSHFFIFSEADYVLLEVARDDTFL